jgi:hypothetical protein
MRRVLRITQSNAACRFTLACACRFSRRERDQSNGEVGCEINLGADQPKGSKGCTVVLSRVRRETTVSAVSQQKQLFSARSNSGPSPSSVTKLKLEWEKPPLFLNGVAG